MKNKYRSKFEQDAAVILKGLCTYETHKVPYTVHRNYIPDFIGKKGNVEVFVEAKGFFRVGDTQKYKAIRDCLKFSQQLVFLLYNPDKKIRKGAKMSMSEWCDKEGLKWYTLWDIKNAFKS